MNHWRARLQLLRLDKPQGILLLWYPTAWALWIANQGMPSLKLVFLFFVGTVLMRSAGCVVNDMADRNIDKHVTRTRLRPITCGTISLKEAIILLTILLTGALVIVINLPIGCLYLAIVALLITFLYPFGKRILNAPQLVLGLAFSMGIPMVYIAAKTDFDRQFILLCIINFIWIIAYDTMYAMTDKEDDVKIGVKSTAIYFGSFDRLIICLMLISLQGLWLFWALLYHAQVLFYLFWALAGIILIYQQVLITQRIPKDCFKAFTLSIYYGLLMWLAVITAFMGKIQL